VRALLLLLALPAAAAAQEREISTDRPNLTDSPITVEPGFVQLEVGLFDRSLDRGGGDRARAWSIGDVNARIGVTRSVEVNVVVQPHLVARDRAGAASGFGDVTVGAKVNLWGNDAPDRVWGTALALKPQVKLPTAGRSLGNGNVEAGLAVPFTMALPAGFGLSLQPGVERVRDRDDRRTVTSAQVAAALDHDLGPANLYAEWVWEDADGPAAQLLDLGATAAVTRNFVVDAGVGIGLTEAADDFRLLVGGSVRF
jgi:hypothetical protein